MRKQHRRGSRGLRRWLREQFHGPWPTSLQRFVPSSAVCGDNAYNGGETCGACTTECGVCPTCSGQPQDRWRATSWWEYSTPTGVSWIRSSTSRTRRGGGGLRRSGFRGEDDDQLAGSGFQRSAFAEQGRRGALGGPPISSGAEVAEAYEVHGVLRALFLRCGRARASGRRGRGCW